MKTYKLSEILQIKNGRDHQELEGGSFPVYGSGGIMRYVNQYLYNKPSILLPRKGTLDNIQYCETPFWTVDTTYYTEVNQEIANAYFLYRYLRLLDLSKLNTGTGVPSMTFDSYYNINVELPELGIQNAIASVLNSLDHKISLNRKANEVLEKMAKQLYDYWFVQFDFPDENGKPYKSSGGKMVYNETLKREIPEGWEVGNILEISNLVTGGTPSKAVAEYWDGDIPFFGPTDCDGSMFQFTTTDKITDEGVRHSAAKLMEENTIIITARGSIGKYTITALPMTMNQSCFAFASIDDNYEHLYFLTEQLIQHLLMKGNGSTFKSIVGIDIETSILSLGCSDIRNKYCEKMSPIFEKIKSNSRETLRLTSIRDFLLPMLMNGQVTIKDEQL